MASRILFISQDSLNISNKVEITAERCCSPNHYRFNKMEKEGVIYWLKPEEGGLKNLPTYELCYAVTVLPQVEPSAWSIKMFILEPDKYVSDCLVAFLVDHAPHEVLNTIESVDVYAGNKKVATIILKTDNKQQTD